MEDICQEDIKNNFMNNNPTIESVEFQLDFSILDKKEFTIESNPFNYRVNFLSLSELKIKIQEYVNSNGIKNVLFIDHNVNKIYKNLLWINHEVFTLNAIESNKTVDSSFKLVDELIAHNFTKKETLISIGGGITQDVSAFTRAIYKRGINWSFMPTTLLSMSDSCIGAKSAINYGTTKNLIGLFSAPREVNICIEFLKTLSSRDILSGYGEIIKLVIIGGQDTLIIFDKIYNKKGLPSEIDERLIRLALLVKKAVIEKDEFEENIRKALNYGHTIGHAVEPLVNYKIPHGIAVSIGMYIENKLSHIYGELSKSECDYLNNLIKDFIDKESLLTLIDVKILDIISNIKKDKKTLGDQVYISVPFKIGKFNMLPVDIDGRFENILKDIFQELIQE